ncbi:ABC transporter ATP-binding protein [Clostridium neuense]|uniref:ABC transporter ATP-binding protein n=1 Tax=Clostridium neuense TaxID=1728934 RepID=A0ABW8TC27_9CLOT
MSILEAKELVKIYGGKKSSSSVAALRGINFTVEKGEFIGVMGPSGSGKSTLLKILGGMDKPSSGHVKLNGNNIENMKKNELALFRRKNIGFVFQDFNLMDSLNLKENVMLPLILDNEKAEIMERKADDIMKFFDIYDIRNKYPYEISGGQQQRTAASRALVSEPAIVLADEPTGNLDSKSSNNVMLCLEKMNKEKESTILMVTHDPFAASFCRRIVFIKDGKIHMEIVKKEGRKEFFDRILDCQAVIGGERNDL